MRREEIIMCFDICPPVDRGVWVRVVPGRPVKKLTENTVGCTILVQNVSPEEMETLSQGTGACQQAEAVILATRSLMKGRVAIPVVGFVEVRLCDDQCIPGMYEVVLCLEQSFPADQRGKPLPEGWNDYPKAVASAV